MTSRKEKLVIFDFDYTLYNAEKWRDIAFLSLADLFQKDEQVFRKIAQDAYDETRLLGYFDPIVFSETIVRKVPGHITPADVLQTIYNPSLFNACYYPDTKKVLESLTTIATLGLFSTNDSEYQKAKHAEIITYFDPNLIFIHKNKQEIMHEITRLTEKYEIFLVDDLISILELTSQQKPEIHTIWIKQGPYAAKVPEGYSYVPNWTIRSIIDLLPIVEDHRVIES